LFFKKGDKTCLESYRPITLLSHVYKLFLRVVTTRLASRFDAFQSPEQAGFRKGYSTVSHIHTVQQVIHKSKEYNQPLCLAFVDCKKAFDSIETWAVLESLQICGGAEKSLPNGDDVRSSPEPPNKTHPIASRCKTLTLYPRNSSPTR
jgi:hypothetical protein